MVLKNGESVNDLREKLNLRALNLVVGIAEQKMEVKQTFLLMYVLFLEISPDIFRASLSQVVGNDPGLRDIRRLTVGVVLEENVRIVIAVNLAIQEDVACLDLHNGVLFRNGDRETDLTLMNSEHGVTENFSIKFDRRNF